MKYFNEIFGFLTFVILVSLIHTLYLNGNIQPAPASVVHLYFHFCKREELEVTGEGDDAIFLPTCFKAVQTSRESILPTQHVMELLV